MTTAHTAHNGAFSIEVYISFESPYGEMRRHVPSAVVDRVAQNRLPSRSFGRRCHPSSSKIAAILLWSAVPILDLPKNSAPCATCEIVTFHLRCQIPGDQFLPGVYDPPAFMLRHAHKDVSLAVALAKEVKVPMRLCNLALEEMTEAMNRGWAERDSRAALLLQQQRAGVEIAVDKARLQAAVQKDGGG